MEEIFIGEIIGIDLDKTLFSCNSFLYNFVAGLNFHNDKNLKHYEVPRDGIYKCSFINKVFKFFNPSKYKAFPEAVETINSLHDDGYFIFFVSSRPNIKPVISMTYEWLNKHNVKYDKLVLGCKNKPAYAYEKGIKFFIDDLRKNCELMSCKGIKPLLFKGSLKNKNKKKLKPALQLQNFTSWQDIKSYFDSLTNIYFDKEDEYDNLEYSFNADIEKSLSK